MMIQYFSSCDPQNPLRVSWVGVSLGGVGCLTSASTQSNSELIPSIKGLLTFEKKNFYG